MEYVILGFLMLRSVTQYEVLQALQQKVSPFYSASLGSIQAALKKLQSSGYITMKKEVVGGRKRNLYTITSLGKDAFKAWMHDDMTESRFESEVSTKLFFMGTLPYQEQLDVIARIIGFLESLVFEMNHAKLLFQEKSYDKAFEEVVSYQFKTLDLGVHHYQSTLAWFEKLFEEKQNQILGGQVDE